MALATGIGASASFQPAIYLPAAGVVLGVILWRRSTLLPASVRQKTILVSRMAGLLLLWVCLGALMERVHHHQFHSAELGTWFSPETGGQMTRLAPVRGWVASPPFRNRNRWRFLLQVEERLQAGKWRPSSGRIRLSVRDPESSLNLNPGDRLQVPVRLRRPRSFGNPGAFDYSRHLQGRGVHFLGTVKSPRLVQFLSSRHRSPGIWVDRLRQRLLRRLEKALPDREDRATRRFLEAVLLGWRRSRSGTFEELLRKTGVFHILSISGLHFGLLFAASGFLVRRLPRGDAIAPAVQVAVALFYVILSGGADPVLRAALSAGWVGWGRTLGRRISAWDAQAQSCITLLLFRPLHLFDPGFQLSFLVTGGLLAGGFPERTFVPGRPRIGQTLRASGRAWLTSLPLLASHFNQISPAALLLGFPAALFLALSLALGALCLLHPFPPAVWVLNHSRDLLGWMCQTTLELPGASVRVPTPAAPLLLVWTTLSLYRLAVSPHRHHGVPPLLNFSMVAVGLLFWLAPAGFAPDSLELIALDVGQGDALLVRFPGGKNVLVDAGGFKDTDFDVGERVVLPALFALGIRDLELVVLTHGHQDHGGGIPAVLEALPAHEVWIGGADPSSKLLSKLQVVAQQRQIPIQHPTRGTLKCLGRSCLEVLHPSSSGPEDGQDPNDLSLVLRVTFQETSLILTGDLEDGGEMDLLASRLLLPTDLLKVAHHGSASSSTSAFLTAVQPSLAVISVGAGNLWGHPSPDVLRRLTDRGIPLSRTDEEGAIRFRSDGGHWVRVPLVP